MDLLTHTCAGWTIGRCFPSERWGKWVTPTAIIAANLPDGEFFFVPRGPYYLLYHRGWSHSLLGIALETAGFSLLVMFAVWFVRRRSATREPPKLHRILIVVGLCAYSHLFLDWWNTYGVRPFYPFDKSWYYGDLAVLMDPWLWLIFAGTLLLGTRFRADNSLAPNGASQSAMNSFQTWGLAFVWSLVIVYLAVFFRRGLRETSTPVAPVIWFACVAAIILIRFKFRTCRRPHRMAFAGIVLVAIYLCALAGFGRWALRQGLEAFERDLPDAVITEKSSNPVHALPWCRHVLIATIETIYQYRVNTITGEISKQRELARNLNDPALSQIKDQLEYLAWKSFARHPVTRRENGWLLLGDARYAVYQSRGDWTELRVRVE